MGSFISDLRHSIRLLIKTPGFSVIAIAALALGIGANTAIFSVVNTVLLQPLPYPEPDRIMRIQRVYKSGDIGTSTSIPKFMAWKSNNQTFDAMALYDFAGPGLNLGSGDRPQQVKGIHVSEEYFRVFGVTPAQGRTFLPQEDQPGGPKSCRAQLRALANALRERPRAGRKTHHSGRRSLHCSRHSPRQLPSRSAG